MRVRFGPFEADLRSGELSRDGRKVPLQDKPFHILALLVERPGELVTRDELRQRLWPADTFVDFEHGLNTAVKKLRQGLEDSAEDPRYVETLARRGYRFIAPVTAPDAETVDPAGAAPARARRFGGRWAASVLAAVLGAAIAGIVLVRDRARPATRPAEAPSLVVLPFANLGGSPQDDYLADGLSEVVITELAKVPGLLVISRNTAFLYRGRPADVRRMASDLHVTHVLEGSVQRADGQLRVSAQLIDAKSGYHLWAEKYDRPARDIFALQDDISDNVGGALRLSLRPAGATRPAAPPTTNLEAYDAYLRGRFHFQKLYNTASAEGAGEAEAAIAQLERAVALDAGFALGHAALGEAYASSFFLVEARKEWEEKAWVSIERALSLDPGLAQAYAARGSLAWTLANGFPHERAAADFRRALALDPNLVDARWRLGRLYMHVGLFEKALAELTAAQRLAPDELRALNRIGMVYTFQQKFESALAAFDKQPEQSLDDERLAPLTYLGRYDDARRVAEACLRKDPTDANFTSGYAVLLARTGDFAGAEEYIGRTLRNDRGLSHFHHAEYHVASAYALMGKKAAAVEWLRAGGRARNALLPAVP